MSGFSPEWLALREPADIAARNPRVLAACRSAFAGRDALVISDMGAGTGASVRALADFLPRRQTWVLIDHDDRNLTAALTALHAWGDSAEGTDIHRGEQRITIEALRHDLAKEPAPWPADTGLVTASALLDLPSFSWIDAFVSELKARRLPALVTLTVDGVMSAEPAHKFDQRVFAAFRKHQGGDKGFGPSAGADAALHLERAFIAAGYTVEAGDSPWIIDRGSLRLLTELLTGIAGAARETGNVDTANIDRWLRDRIADTTTLVVGHRDVFARP